MAKKPYEKHRRSLDKTLDRVKTDKVTRGDKASREQTIEEIFKLDKKEIKKRIKEIIEQ